MPLLNLRIIINYWIEDSILESNKVSPLTTNLFFNRFNYSTNIHPNTE